MKRRALIVDDERVIRLTLEEALAETHDCSLVCDGREGYRLATEANIYDLIVMDIAMENWDGISALSLIEALNPGCRIVVVSGRIVPEVEQQLSAFSCVKKIIHKPVSLKHFLEVVNEIEALS